MDRKSGLVESAIAVPPKPVVLARLGHAKWKDDQHKIVDMKQTARGIRGKRAATYEMKVSNYELDYVGRSMDLDKQDHDWIMAVRNRGTGKTIFTPFDMVRFHAKIEHEEIVPKLDPADFEERRRRLIMEFGSQKQKKALASSLRNALDEQSTSHLFAHAVNYMKENERSKSIKSEKQEPLDESMEASPSKRIQISSALPTFNPDAKTASEIYDIKDIVPDDLLDELKTEAERYLLLTPKEVKEEGHPPLVMAIIEMSSTNTTNLDERTTKVAYCLYLSYMIRLSKMFARLKFVAPSAFREGEFESVPSTVVNDLMSKFTSAGGMEASIRTSWKSKSKLSVTTLHKDMLLSRIAVLLLILSGQYAFNVHKAAMDLGASEGRVAESKLISVCKMLGCRTEKHPKTRDTICILEQPPKPKEPLLKKQGFGGRRGGKR